MNANHYKCGCITGLYDGEPTVFNSCNKSNCVRLKELLKKTKEELKQRKIKEKR